MISIYKLKPAFQNALRPILRRLHHYKITANQITISSIILSFIIGVLFWNADINSIYLLALPIGLLLRMALNALDGMMAREYNQMSKKGELLNEIGDVVSDIFIFFPLLKFHHEAKYVVVAFIVLSIMNELAGVLGKAVNNERRYDGPMGKSDRALLISLYGIISYLIEIKDTYFYYLFLAACILLVISTYIRLKKSLP